jgi:ubiquinone/menaquinone biosynthesis C-methylase UbiE
MSNLLDDSLYQSTRTAWENIWQTADIAQEVKTMQYTRSQEIIHAYLPYLNKQDLILEAGSGLSAVMVTLKQMGYRMVGLDYALNALQASKQYDSALELMAGDVHALPYADKSVGAYLSFGVLEHFPHGMQPALREAYRVLKPGGTLVLTIPYPSVVWRLAQKKREATGKVRIDEEFYESTYTRYELISACNQVGFDVVKTMPTSHAFTLWTAHPIFRAPGYYVTAPLAETAGAILRTVMPWAFNYMTLVIARK